MNYYDFEFDEIILKRRTKKNKQFFEKLKLVWHMVRTHKKHGLHLTELTQYTDRHLNRLFNSNKNENT